MSTSISKRIATLALSAAALVGGLAGASTASAASASCTKGTAIGVVAGAKVAVYDSASVFPSSCLRVNALTYSGGAVTVNYSLRDTAQDGQFAAVYVKLYGARGSVSNWLKMNQTGTEAFVGPYSYRTWFTNGDPVYRVEFLSCRVNGAGQASACAGVWV